MTRGEFTRLDPESCIAGEAGRKEGERWWGGGFGVIKSLGTFSFLLIGWLSKSSWLSHKARSDTKGNNPPFISLFFFFLLSRMAKVRSLIISPMLSSHLVQSVYFFASPFNHCRDWERSFTVHVLHTNTRSKFFISVLFLLFLFFFPFCRADFSALSSSQVFQSSSEHLKWSPVSSQHL